MNCVVLGLLAGAFTTFASLPQIVRVVRTRSMDDVSLTTLCMFLCGISLWIAYGVMIRATPVIAWNVLSFIFYLAQIVLKVALASTGPHRERTVAPASA
jgi:MtN3 and saliva related transmembrane protein